MKLVYDIGFARAADVLARQAAHTQVRLAAHGVTCKARFEVSPHARRASGLCTTAATAPTEPALNAYAGLAIIRGGRL